MMSRREGEVRGGRSVAQRAEQGRPRSDRMRTAIPSGGDAAVFHGVPFRLSGGKRDIEQQQIAPELKKELETMARGAMRNEANEYISLEQEK